MDLKRIFRHFSMTPWQVRQVFPAASLAAIEQAITTAESSHGGEIRFAVEGALPAGPLLRGQSARERAVDIFSRLRIWDTEHNNGVLIYLLLADRDVEIVADRGIHSRAGEEAWEPICRAMETAFQQGRFELGVIAGIEAISHHLARHYPGDSGRRDELPDQPVLL